MSRCPQELYQTSVFARRNRRERKPQIQKNHNPLDSAYLQWPKESMDYGRDVLSSSWSTHHMQCVPCMYNIVGFSEQSVYLNPFSRLAVWRGSGSCDSTAREWTQAGIGFWEWSHHVIISPSANNTPDVRVWTHPSSGRKDTVKHVTAQGRTNNEVQGKPRQAGKIDNGMYNSNKKANMDVVQKMLNTQERRAIAETNRRRNQIFLVASPSFTQQCAIIRKTTTVVDNGMFSAWAGKRHYKRAVAKLG